MFQRVLVANRGEIAVRVFRTLRRLGIEGIAVYSDADLGALHARTADRAVRIGPAEARASYLNIDKILEAAKKTRAEAIHPGYGFLSENETFARRVIDHGLAWIGPPPEAMQKVGNKVPARELAKKNGVPIAPGSDGALADAKDAMKVAQDIGYPVILKASAGGGGIGMRVVRKKEEMEREFEGARSTAMSAFGDGSVFMEKFLERPRHIELQFMGDKRGHGVHFGERECSIQRRHQKLIEEAPSPALTPAQRQQLGELGVKLMKAAGYHNAGTLEFLYENGKFYFNEVNARLQVEHPVTERIYGVDLVETQIRVAAGEQLQHRQSDLRPNGHAIEVRINAEDPLRDFLPTPGPLLRWHLPTSAHIRVDSGVEEGWRVPQHYDSLLAKVVSWGANREEAIQRLSAALAEMVIEGTTTNLGFHRLVAQDPAFKAGDLTTRFVAEQKIVERLQEVHASRRGAAMKIAAAMASAPRGGPSLVYARSLRPRRLEGPR